VNSPVERPPSPVSRYEFWRGDFWLRVINRSEPRLRRELIVLSFVMVAVVGTADFLTGFELSLLVFYFVPVCLAVAAAGRGWGAAVALASVAAWLSGDFAAGARYANPLVAGWNALIALGTYLVVIWLFGVVLRLHRQMEARVRPRTAALTEEIAERERLEQAVLEVGERERRSIGHDLHDGLGQHLTGTAFVAQAVEASLLARGAGEAAEVARVVALIEEGIEETRNLARGLLLPEIERDGLILALQELAETTRRQFGVECGFDCEEPIVLPENGAATHLFQIAREAVRNAIRHGAARHVSIRLSRLGEAMTLSVCDDGSGLPPAAARGAGLGLRIMAHRARIIGGCFSIAAQGGGGTAALCRLPLARGGNS
jgi:signal transduction histidine kinase